MNFTHVPYKKYIIISLVVSFISTIGIIILVRNMWGLGLFDFGGDLSIIEFEVISKDVYVNIFSMTFLDIFVLIWYVYNYWYKKIKKYGLEYISTIINKMRKELILAYLILILVIIFHSLFPIFASLFVPLVIMLLCPFTTFILLMNYLIK